jgi:hypothetical protein
LIGGLISLLIFLYLVAYAGKKSPLLPISENVPAQNITTYFFSFSRQFKPQKEYHF